MAASSFFVRRYFPVALDVVAKKIQQTAGISSQKKSRLPDVICGGCKIVNLKVHYHSFTLFASIFKKMNNKIVNPQSPDPP